MSNCYAVAAGSNFEPEPEENVLDSIFKQYESVIIESLVTSFGLDFLVADRHGGDVDTIHNVRQIGIDPKMDYKNEENKSTYAGRAKYDDTPYRKGTHYQETKREARENYRATGEAVQDAYAGGELQFLGKSKGANPAINAELDHVIAAKSIHEDRGRILAGLKGEDLADAPENLKFTNKSLNASMQDKDIPAYLEMHPELAQSTKENMQKSYDVARKSYEVKLAKAYYTSPAFAKDVGVAAGNMGLTMGLRQVLGFVFTEIWFAVKKEFEQVGEPFELGDLFLAIGNGVKRGFEHAKEKYGELLSKFGEGAIAGALSSLTTTLCNIFFTTAKNVVKIIRQSYVSVVKAGEVLFINPDNLLFGERMRAMTKILSVGASVVVGGMVSELIGKTAVGVMPVIGDIVQTFCGTLVTGIMSCSLLYFLDRSEIMNKLVHALDKLHTSSTELNYFCEQAAYFEKYAAQLMEIDFEKFREETGVYCTLATDLDAAEDERALNVLLRRALDTIGVHIPWRGDFDEFMQKETVLVFE